MIAIIDYGMGNLASVAKALKYIGAESVITSDPSEIRRADGVILPGVGAFGPAMEALKSKGLDAEVKAYAKTGRPLLGICLGMQLMLTGSEEGAPEGQMLEGLDLIPGKVLKFPKEETTDKGLKVPQIGWNRLTDVTGDLPRSGDYVYFVHSFYCCPEDDRDSAAKTEYGIKYTAALQRDNIFATQFHPEKSGEAGLQMLIRFVRRTAK
ncbi:MAG: imidazole glycerol phosphate synthase subunit HisH [Clostridiales bacterium]|nr:imidazole glycerol phosphate synthase subunit HisH [Clostridiales bacterium]